MGQEHDLQSMMNLIDDMKMEEVAPVNTNYIQIKYPYAPAINQKTQSLLKRRAES